MNRAKCPTCGRSMPRNAQSQSGLNEAAILSQAGSIMGRRAGGERKRRAVDYAALAAKSHEARRRNKLAASVEVAK